MTIQFIYCHHLKLVVFLTLIISAGCSKIPNINNGEGSFTNKTGGYTLEHPDNWLAFELPNGNHGDNDVSGYLTFSGKEYPSIIIAQKSSLSPSMDEAIQWGESRILNRLDGSAAVKSYHLGDPEFIEPQNNEINLVAQRTYTIFYNDDSYGPVKKEDVYIVTKDRNFILTYSSLINDFDSDIETFHAMIDSFRLIDN